MKYFAHLCTAQDDDKFDRLFEEYGFEGYGVYWWLCEHVGRRKKTANDNPEYLFNTKKMRSSRTLERGVRRTRIAEIIHALSDLKLVDAQEEPSWIAVKIPKLNAYSAEWQKRLAKQDSVVTPESLRSDSVQTPDQLGPEEKEYKRKKRKKDLALQPALEGAADRSQPNPEEPTTTTKGLEMIRTLTAQLEHPKPLEPTNGAGKAAGKKEFNLPEQLDAYQDNIWRAMIASGIVPQDQVDTIAAAYFAYREGDAEAHELASLIDGFGVSGQDKARLYQVMGV
jgi:hypothetical protein